MSCIKNYHKILVVIASEDVTNVNERWTSLEFYYEKAAGKKKPQIPKGTSFSNNKYDKQALIFSL